MAEDPFVPNAEPWSRGWYKEYFGIGQEADPATRGGDDDDDGHRRVLRAGPSGGGGGVATEGPPSMALSQYATSLIPPVDTSRSEAALSDFRQASQDQQKTLGRLAGERRAVASDLEVKSATQAAERAEAKPPALTLPPTPDIRPRPFLDPGPDASLLSQMHTVLLGVGQMAQQITGLRGPATAAVASLKGALEGWQAGDKERANRSLQRFEKEQQRLLAEHRDRVERYRALIEDQKTSWDQRMSQLGVLAGADGFEALAAAAKVGEIDKVLSVYGGIEDTQAKHQLAFAALGAHIMRWKTEDARHEREKADQIKREGMSPAVRDELTRTGIPWQTATDEQMAKAVKDAEARDIRVRGDERRATAMAGLEATSGERASGEFYDAAQGRIRSITKGEERADLSTTSTGGAPRFKPLRPQEVNLLERLAVAPPILDRLDRLVEKITAAAPGENITKGLIQRLSRIAGIGTDVTELRNLNVDLAAEVAAALSQGTPRMTIFKMILGDVAPNEFMTTATAQRQVATARTTLRNRVQAATGDPKALEKLSAGLSPYGTQRIRKIGDPTKVFEGPAGSPVPPGFELVR